MSSNDVFVFNNAIKETSNEFVMEKREMIFTVDSNNGSYSDGRVYFDLASLSNCGKFCDFQNSKLVIPVVVKVSGTSLSNNEQNAFACCLKNHNVCVDSMSVQISNHGVVDQSCEFSHIPATFKMLTEFSENELAAMGYSLGFFRDNALSLKTRGATGSTLAPAGYEYNNDPNDTTTGLAPGAAYGSEAAISQFASNQAIMQRMLNSSIDCTAGTEHASLRDAFRETGKSFCERDVGVITYYHLLTIPLKFLNDWFNQIPNLVRNSYIKLTINTNLVSRSVITFGGDDTAPVYSTLTSQLSSKCVPYMLTEINKGWSKRAVAAAPNATSSLIIESGIGRLSDTTSPHPSFTSCRLYTPTYILNPEVESKYLSNPIKNVLYNAHFRAVSPTIAANGGSLNSFLVSNGISRIRSLLIYPVRAGAVNNFLNPWSTCPMTTAPYAVVRNFNVRIGGSPHYANNINYGFEQFQDEIRALSINGGNELGLGSGLLNQLQWSSGFRYIYVDLSRKLSQGVDDMSKSVYVDLNNAAPYDVVYHIFVEYQKQVSLDVGSGQLVL